MFDFLVQLFDSSGFPARWENGIWSDELGWTHILADVGISSAHVVLPVLLVFVARRRPDLPFRHLFVLVGAVILGCGLIHLMDAAMFWWPAYRLTTALKVVTVGLSWAAVVGLVWAVPRILSLRGPESLEQEVAARTAELAAANAALHAERERFRATLASIGDAVIATDPDGRVTFVNPVAEGLTGWPAETAVGRPLTEVFRIVNETTRQPVESPTTRALRDGIVVGLANHTVLLGRGGDERPIDDCAAPIRDAGGAVAGAVLVFRDVTEHRRAEEQLKASEARYRLLFDANPHPMWVYDRETLRFLAVNVAAETRYGYTRAEFLGMTIKDIRPPEDVPRLLASLAADPGGLDDAGVWRHRRKDGSELRVRITGHTLTFDGRPAELILAVDVTAQLAAEEQVREAERRLQQTLAAGGMGAFDWDLHTGRTVWSDGLYLLFGYGTDRPTPLEYRHYADRVHPDDRAATEGRRDAAKAERRAYTHEYRLRWPDGTVRWVAGTGRYTYDSSGRAVRLTGVIQDITARHEAAAALAESNRLYRLLADHTQDVVMLADAARRLVYASPSCGRLTGYGADELIGMNRSVLVHPDDRPAVDRHWAEAVGGRATTVEWRCRHRDGRLIWVETVLTPVPDGSVVVSTSRDVTARRAAEDRLRQAQKLEAVGHLAGGVAHDFNNLLTVVNGCGELLREMLPPDGPAAPLVADVVRAGERGAALTRQLLAFSRQQMLRVEVFDPNRVTRDTVALLTRLLGEDVRLELRLDPVAGHVRADPDQFSQVLVNLAVNARDAMPTGGVLTVTTDAAEFTAETLPPSPDARSGRFVRLTVTDTGHGMTPEVLSHLFEPFFTTKPAGKGTGLGLATVYGIVKQTGGFVTVRSEPGQGATFAVHLPWFDPHPPAVTPAPVARPRTVGRETILVVEDDEAVRTLTTIVLTRQGYRVETAETGAAAVAVCDRLAEPPDLVLTDVVMPGMSGRELAERLGTRYPRLKVVFLSGYTADAVLRHGVEQSRVAFLQKPYTPDVLARFVREVLDQGERPA